MDEISLLLLSISAKHIAYLQVTISGLASAVHVNRRLLRSRSRPVGLVVIFSRGSSTQRDTLQWSSHSHVTTD